MGVSRSGLSRLSVAGRETVAVHGLVTGTAILGANVFRDIFAAVRDIAGGRSAAYERELNKAQDIAVSEMVEKARELGGNAVIGVDLDYETIGGGMLMVSVSGTSVTVR